MSDEPMSDEPMKTRGEPVELDDELALELSRLELSWQLGDSYLDDSFLPALRARGHEYVLGAGVAPSAADVLTPVDIAAIGRWVRDVERRRLSNESPVADPACRDGESGRHQLFDRARRKVEAFRTSGPHQAELKALLLSILRHVARESADSAEATRWEPVVRVYLRVLISPEMASDKAFLVLKRLLALKADELTERRLQLVLGHRKPRTPRTSRRRSRRRRVVLFDPTESDITTERDEIRRHVYRRQR